MSESRKLAAILFADIVGSTTLMQKDEASANTLLEKFHRILNESVLAHQGQVINNYGDGCVCTFDSAVAAMKCAKAMQIIFQKEPKVPVRIGLHSGDVMFKDNNVYGYNVSVASRIESVGVAGAILFSKEIKRHISNQVEFKIQSLGVFNLKNVEQDMEVFALANEGIIVPQENELKGKIQSNIPSIAVLPFEDMSPQKDQEYFGDGIAEEILNTLANLKELKVAGRTSSFSFKGKEATISEIGKALNVNHVLEGSVRKHGDKVRVTAQLIKVGDGFHIWSEKYDRNFEDIFSIQDELAHSIGEVLLEKLIPAQIEKLKSNLPRNSKAYELFLSGKYIHWKAYRAGSHLQKDFDKSEQLFLEALQIDPTYALAYAGLADLYDSHVLTLLIKKDSSGAKKYRALSTQHGEKAYQLNPELSYVNTVRGYVQVGLKKFEAAYKSLIKGIELSPNNPDAIFGLQYLYRSLGLYEDAIQIGERLREIDPLFIAGLEESLSNNCMVGNEVQAIKYAQYIFGIRPQSLPANKLLFDIYFESNKQFEAAIFLEKISRIDPTYFYLSELNSKLVQNDSVYIEEKRTHGTHYDRYVIYNFYGEDELAEMELRNFLENINDNIDPTNKIRFTNYLYYSKGKLFEKYQGKGWFKAALRNEKKTYDYLLTRFPRAGVVLK